MKHTVVTVPAIREPITTSPGFAKKLLSDYKLDLMANAFSPRLLQQGLTRRALELVLELTDFRIRVLTKNAVVGTEEWINFFQRHPDRFVVGLSTGTLNDAWAKTIELGTSPPSDRLQALHRLLDAGVATYGMLCPVFPDVLHAGQLAELVAAIRPELCEHVWAEPYNDRMNWEAVRKGYRPGTPVHEFMTDVYERGKREMWSRYAADLYQQLHAAARRGKWLPKLRYLLYEDLITVGDASVFAKTKLAGVLLQSKPDSDGLSQNPNIAAVQGLCRIAGKS